ncbi:MAG: sugar ABC transporter permease [Planctomycetota bacterium]|nr:sugar ABC transporter permease [Planctomycetota bacterium]
MSKKKQSSETATGVAFVLPNFIGFLAFVSLPVIASLVLAFFRWDLLTAPKFTGLSNFVDLLKDESFGNALFNTAFLMLGIPLSMAASLFLAVMVNKAIRGVVVYRTLYFLPSICSGIGLLLLWRWIYNEDFGLLNVLLSYVGVKGPDWLGSVAWAKPALIFMGVWTAMGGPSMILYLAALHGVDPTLYEAAEMDGANAWRRFRHITWPMISPTTFFIFIMSIIGGFQGNFDSVYVMTRGGPAGSTVILSYHIYNHAYVLYNMGYAAAMAWVLFIIVFAITLLTWRYGGRRVHYF